MTFLPVPCILLLFPKTFIKNLSYLFRMFAVIETGGKQYLVKAGDVIRVEKIELEKGQEAVFDKVLLTADENGENIVFGKPYIDGVSIRATVEEQGRHAKVRVVKYKRKVRYKRTIGHRQAFTKVKIAKV